MHARQLCNGDALLGVLGRQAGAGGCAAGVVDVRGLHVSQLATQRRLRCVLVRAPRRSRCRPATCCACGRWQRPRCATPSLHAAAPTLQTRAAAAAAAAASGTSFGDTVASQTRGCEAQTRAALTCFETASADGARRARRARGSDAPARAATGSSPRSAGAQADARAGRAQSH